MFGVIILVKKNKNFGLKKQHIGVKNAKNWCKKNKNIGVKNETKFGVK